MTARKKPARSTAADREAKENREALAEAKALKRTYEAPKAKRRT